MNALAHYTLFSCKEKLLWILNHLPAYKLLLRSNSKRFNLTYYIYVRIKAGRIQT